MYKDWTKSFLKIKTPIFVRCRKIAFLITFIFKAISVRKNLLCRIGKTKPTIEKDACPITKNFFEDETVLFFYDYIMNLYHTL